MERENYFLEKVNLILLAMAFSILAVLSASASAQTGNVTIQIVSGGNLSVNVTDADTGSAIASANITIREQGGNEILGNGTTNSSGIFISSQLLAGNYTVNASKSGYDSNSTNATVLNGTTVNVFITLKSPVASPGGGGGGGVGGGGGAGEGKKEKEPDIDFEKADEHRKKAREGDSYTMRITGPIERTEAGVALLAKGGKLEFEEHTILINDIVQKRVNITVNSTPTTLLLGVGEAGYVDFEKDGRNDVKIVVNSVQENRADITFTSLRTVRVLSYPAQIFIPQGSSDLYLVSVANFGAEEQKDITVSVIGSPHELNVTPKIIESLRKNEIGIYAISLAVPDDAEVEKRKLILKVTSNKITTEYEMILNVEENLELSFDIREKKRIEREISNAQLVATEIWNSALQKQLQGLDVGRVLSFLRTATRNLNEAKIALDLNELQKANGLAREAKKQIEEAVIALGRARIATSKIAFYAVIILAVLIAAFLIAKYAKKIRESIRKKKELREIEEKLEKWEKK